MMYELVIGLEAHARLAVESKLLCGCAARYGDPPNTNACPTCAGLPGALPTLNEAAVEMALAVSLAFGCTVAPVSRFARKNYFYPDLPKGYQITQHEQPLASAGAIPLVIDDAWRAVPIERVHLEEDAGKSTHRPAQGRSLVDLNRAGTALVEIVTAPERLTPGQATELARELRRTLRYLEVCDGAMERGAFRFDANLSLRPAGDERLGTRVELKNLNSFGHLRASLRHESRRLAALLDRGDPVVRETRGWDASSGRTYRLRGKEALADYRYFPEPDLPPLRLTAERIEVARRSVPLLPWERRRRLVERVGLTTAAAAALTERRATAELFDLVLDSLGEAEPTAAANLVIEQLLPLLARRPAAVTEGALAREVGELLRLIDAGEISGTVAKTVLDKIIDGAGRAREIVEREGLTQITDRQLIEVVCRRVLADEPELVERYRGGQRGLRDHFVGAVMRETEGRADPQVVGETMERLLDERN
jgi:aspartyl-tRNA(Asn)/glutamyl-tRNA(Gln) amidotransferase subunit B